MKRAALLALLCCACRSRVPWRVVDAEIGEKGRVSVSVEASVTGFKATITAEGECRLHFDRDPALAPTPAVPQP